MGAHGASQTVLSMCRKLSMFVSYFVYFTFVNNYVLCLSIPMIYDTTKTLPLRIDLTSYLAKDSISSRAVSIELSTSFGRPGKAGEDFDIAVEENNPVLKLLKSRRWVSQANFSNYVTLYLDSLRLWSDVTNTFDTVLPPVSVIARILPTPAVSVPKVLPTVHMSGEHSSIIISGAGFPYMSPDITPDTVALTFNAPLLHHINYKLELLSDTTMVLHLRKGASWRVQPTMQLSLISLDTGAGKCDTGLGYINTGVAIAIVQSGAGNGESNLSSSSHFTNTKWEEPVLPQQIYVDMTVVGHVLSPVESFTAVSADAAIKNARLWDSRTTLCSSRAYKAYADKLHHEENARRRERLRQIIRDCRKDVDICTERAHMINALLEIFPASYRCPYDEIMRGTAHSSISSDEMKGGGEHRDGWTRVCNPSALDEDSVVYSMSTISTLGGYSKQIEAVNLSAVEDCQAGHPYLTVERGIVNYSGASVYVFYPRYHISYQNTTDAGTEYVQNTARGAACVEEPVDTLSDKLPVFHVVLGSMDIKQRPVGYVDDSHWYPTYTLQSIMDALGHDRIHLLILNFNNVSSLLEVIRQLGDRPPVEAGPLRAPALSRVEQIVIRFTVVTDISSSRNGPREDILVPMANIMDICEQFGLLPFSRDVKKSGADSNGEIVWVTMEYVFVQHADDSAFLPDCK